MINDANLFDHFFRNVISFFLREGSRESKYVTPRLRPHISQQMRRNRPLFSHQFAPILLPQLMSYIRVYLKIQWPQLLPKSFNLVHKFWVFKVTQPEFRIVGKIWKKNENYCCPKTSISFYYLLLLLAASFESST